MGGSQRRNRSPVYSEVEGPPKYNDYYKKEKDEYSYDKYDKGGKRSDDYYGGYSSKEKYDYDKYRKGDYYSGAGHSKEKYYGRDEYDKEGRREYDRYQSEGPQRQQQTRQWRRQHQ